MGEPFVEVHPQDAVRLGLAPAHLARLHNQHGSAILRVVVTDQVRPGDIFVPMHWTGETAPSGRIGALVSAVTDPLSGQPDSKGAAVGMAPWPAGWFAFVAGIGPISPRSGYWACRATHTGMAAELAQLAPPDDLLALTRAICGLPDAEVAMMTDPARGITRLALITGGRIAALVFAGPVPVALSRDAAIARIGTAPSADMLSPVPPADRPDPGPIICACTGTGRNTLLAAIAGGCRNVTGLGASTGAGTNCGACRPELAALIDAHPLALAAE